MSINKFTLLLVLTLLFKCFGYSQTIAIETKGAFKEIDIARDVFAIEALNGNNQDRKMQVIDSIVKNPDYFNPSVLFVLSRELRVQNRIDEAAFWFYLADLRATYDVNLCMDKSAERPYLCMLDNYGSLFYENIFLEPDKYQGIIRKVIDFTKKHDEKYDHRWINLHGFDAFLVSMGDKPMMEELSRPTKKWKRIKKRTINQFNKDFQRHFSELRRRKVEAKQHNHTFLETLPSDTIYSNYSDKGTYVNLSNERALPETIKPFYYYIQCYLAFYHLNINDYWIKNTEDIRQDSLYIYLETTHKETFIVDGKINWQNQEARKNAKKGEPFPVRIVVGNPSGKDRIIVLEKSTKKIKFASLTT
jgi:hypothetical protein